MPPQAKANLLYFVAGIPLGILGTAVVLIFLFGAKGDSYDTAADAAAAGAFERGWLPAFVPREARDLREVHYVSDGWTWGSFRAPSSSTGWLMQLKGVEGRGSIRIARPPLRARFWWPNALSGTLDPPHAKQAGFDVFIADEAIGVSKYRVYVFVHRDSDTVYFHRAP